MRRLRGARVRSTATANNTNTTANGNNSTTTPTSNVNGIPLAATSAANSEGGSGPGESSSTPPHLNSDPQQPPLPPRTSGPASLQQQSSSSRGGETNNNTTTASINGVKYRGSTLGLRFNRQDPVVLSSASSSAAFESSSQASSSTAPPPPPVVGAWVFKNRIPSYPPIWNEFRKSKTLCDATLQSSDGDTFPVHRAILAATSPYFKSLFVVNSASATTATTAVVTSSANGDDNDNTDDDDDEPLETYALSGIDSASLSTILDFSYTGQFQLSKVNIFVLLPIVFKLELIGMLQQCCAFIISSLTPANCLKIYKLGQTYFCPKLLSTTKQFILKHWTKLIDYEDFKELDFEILEEFLRDDYLNVKHEQHVFETIRQWIEHKPVPERTSRLIELFQCIRFGLMSFNYFSTVVFTWKYVQEHREIEESLYDASIFLTELDSRNGSDLDLNDPIARPRVPHEIIFAIGGWSAGSPTSFMETYDHRADRWFLIPNSDVSPRAYHGLVSLDGLIYMIGGFDGQDHFNTMRCYDPVNKVWSEKACMHYPRCYVSCCVLGRHIYAIGGFNGRTRMNNVERYNVDLNQWEEIPPMDRQRSDASACSMKGKVYVAGGFNGQEVLSSVEVYDPNASEADGQWTFIHPMNTPRSGVTLTCYKDYIYAIGGFNGFTRLATAEKYSPDGEPIEWTSIASMSTPRSNFATAVLGDMIYAIGGFNGTTTIPFVECYDPKQNEWFDTTAMNLNRSALSACVVAGLSNAKDYSYLSRVQELLGLSEETISSSPTSTT